MTARTDTERVLDLFLAPEPERLADRVLDAALADIAVTSQRPVLRLPWRFPELRAGSRAASFAAIALVAVVGAAGLGALIANDPGFGGLPTPTPTVGPTATPTPTPAATGPRPLRRLDGTGLLDPGTYVLDLFPVDLAFDIPATGPTGWKVETSSQGYAMVTSDTPQELRYAFHLFIVSGVYVNPCNERSGVVPPIGSSVDDLVTTLSNQQLIQASTPIDVTIGAFAGKQIELTGLDGCPEIWVFAAGHKISVFPGEERTLQVLDVDGVTVLLELWAPDERDPDIGASFDDILDTFHIEALP